MPTVSLFPNGRNINDKFDASHMHKIWEPAAEFNENQTYSTISIPGDKTPTLGIFNCKNLLVCVVNQNKEANSISLFMVEMPFLSIWELF